MDFTTLKQSMKILLSRRLDRRVCLKLISIWLLFLCLDDESTGKNVSLSSFLCSGYKSTQLVPPRSLGLPVKRSSQFRAFTILGRCAKKIPGVLDRRSGREVRPVRSNTDIFYLRHNFDF